MSGKSLSVLKQFTIKMNLCDLTDKELLDWIQASPNPRFKLVYDEWLSANSISLRSAILAVINQENQK